MGGGDAATPYGDGIDHDFAPRIWSHLEDHLRWIFPQLQGLGFEYSATFFELQLANMTGPETSFGVNLNFADSDLEFAAGPFTASESEGQILKFCRIRRNLNP